MLKFIPNADAGAATADADGIPGCAPWTSPVPKARGRCGTVRDRRSHPRRHGPDHGDGEKESLNKIVKDGPLERGFKEVKFQKFRKSRSEYFWGS
jgi:hypothetical protein